MAAILSVHSEKADDGAVCSCPFCDKSGYKRLGNHLPRCPERNGRDYTFMLSVKTLNNKKGNSCKFKCCPKCLKKFARLDTHLKNSSCCRDIPSSACLSSMSEQAPSVSSCTLPSQVPLEPGSSAGLQQSPSPSSGADQCLQQSPSPSSGADQCLEPTPRLVLPTAVEV